MPDYATLQGTSAATVTNSDPESVTIQFTQYDRYLGTPTAPLNQTFSLDQVNGQIDQLNQQMSNLQSQLDNWNAILAEFPIQAIPPKI